VQVTVLTYESTLRLKSKQTNYYGLFELAKDGMRFKKKKKGTHK